MAGWKAYRNNDVLKVDMPGACVGWEQRFLMTSDWHWDNPACDLELLKRHLDEARELGAGVFIVGDLFCAMQGKYDKRSSKDAVRPEHQNGSYLDSLEKTCADWLEPYADLIVAISDGNHELSIRDRHETDLIERLIGRLNDRTGSQIHHLGYDSFIVFSAELTSTGRDAVTMFATHGHSNSAPVTMGAIAWARERAYADADIFVSGHDHNRSEMEGTKVGPTAHGHVVRRDQLSLKLGTYKDAWGCGGSKFEHVRGHGPKPMGGRWLRFRRVKGREPIVYSSERAV